jgi:hypothetical protein
MSEERMGFPPPLVRRCIIVHVDSPCSLILLSPSIMASSGCLSSSGSHIAWRYTFFLSTVIFSNVQYLMSDTTTRIPQLVHTTTATQNASILFSEGEEIYRCWRLARRRRERASGQSGSIPYLLARSIASIGKRGFGVVNSVFWSN